MRSHAKAASAGSIECGTEPSLGLLGFCAIAAFLLVAMLGASAAQAANSFVPAGDISAGELTTPARIAVDETTGNVLVVDTAKNRVDVFNSSGPGASLLTTIGEADLSGPYGIAIDQSNGDVYVTDPGNELIRRYSTDGAPTPTYTLDSGYTGPAAGTGSEEVGSFKSAIAVDATNGNLLVADRGNDRVSRFSSAGAFVSSFNGADSTDGAFTHLEDVTLSPAGEIFVVDGDYEVDPSRVLRFSNAGAYEATLRAPAGTGDAYLTYNSTDSELIVGDGRQCFFCTASFHVLDPTDGATLFNVTVPAEWLSGLAFDPNSGRLYAAASRGEFFAPPKVAVFASQMHPELVLDAPTPVTAFSVHLSGTVDPGGVATEYHFEVSKDGGTTWQKSPEPDASAGEGTSPIAVEADLAVEPNSSYIAKLVASNTEGAVDATPTQPFVTAVSPPATVTGSATDLAEAGAVLNGTINPYGLLTTFYFEYGPTTAYGTKVPAGTESPAGKGTVAKAFSRKLSGLTPGVTYHFRLVATSSAGTVQGLDRSFTALASGSVAVRAYEQVTPADKGGATVIPRIAFQAAADGNGLSYTTKTSPQTTPALPRSVALRGADDWSERIDTDLPTNVPPDRGFFEYTTLAISDDFTHTFSVSNRALAPGAIEDGVNLYSVDLASGNRRLVAAIDEPGFLVFAGAQQQGKYLAGAPDFSWIVFGSPYPLVSGAPSDAIYRWSEADGLEVVSSLSNGELSSGVRASSGRPYEPVSADGSRIYYTAVGGSEEGVFLWEEGKPPVPVAVRPHADGLNPPILLGTNSDGRYAFMASSEKLTPDAPAELNKSDLYRYDVADDSLEYLGAQVIVSLGGNTRADVGGFGIGAEGDTIYFNSQGEEGNLWLQAWHDGAVDTLGPAIDIGEERSSPNGRYFVHRKDGLIYLYDADSGESSCVSCSQDGTPAPGAGLPLHGEIYVSNQYPDEVDDRGTVYFDSPAALVSADVNGSLDVYAFRDGRLTLISPGDGDFVASLVDISPRRARRVLHHCPEVLSGRTPTVTRHL